MKYVIFSPGQSLMDMAVQEYGTPAGMVAIVEDNPGTFPGLNSQASQGQKIAIREELDPDKVQVVRYMARNNIRVLTGTTGTGIGTWTISSTFKVS